MDDVWAGTKTAIAIVLCAILVIGGWMWIYPNYKVWSAGQSGKAELAQADYNKQIQVVNAKAQQEAATYQKQSSITRAEGRFSWGTDNVNWKPSNIHIQEV
jgi:predicted negative regulator of RcsB-dependent stress response